MRQSGFSEVIVLVIVLTIFGVTLFIANTQGATFSFIRGSEPVAELENSISQVSVSDSTPIPTPNPTEGMILPDMKLEPPEDLYIVRSAGRKILRFDTTFANVGKGPLELVGEADTEKQVTVATQRIKKTDGTTEERVIGEFVYHPTHNHWHVDRYAQFEIYNFGLNGQRRQQLAKTVKFSFCIWDEHSYDLGLENAPQTRQFSRCPENVQGVSPGWGDTYTARTDGQEIDITDIPDGSYLVRSVVNADSTIVESDYTNNEAILYVEITGNNIREIDPS